MTEGPECVGFAIVLLMACVLAFCVGGCVGEMKGKNDTRKEAVEAGVGKWVVDEATGATKFSFSK